MARPKVTALIRGTTLMVGFFLAGCGNGYDLQPLFRTTNTPQFITVADVEMRSGQEDEDSVVAVIPKGTVVEMVNEVAKETMMEMKVSAPQGTGWVYNRYIALREPPEAQE